MVRIGDPAAGDGRLLSLVRVQVYVAGADSSLAGGKNWNMVRPSPGS